MEKREHERLMVLSESEIFSELGRALLGLHFGATKLSDGEAEAAGRSWFDSVLPTIREKICGNALVEEQFLSNASSARNAALLAALDTALTKVFGGIPAATISHAVALYGYHKICGAT